MSNCKNKNCFDELTKHFCNYLGPTRSINSSKSNIQPPWKLHKDNFWNITSKLDKFFSLLPLGKNKPHSTFLTKLNVTSSNTIPKGRAPTMVKVTVSQQWNSTMEYQLLGIKLCPVLFPTELNVMGRRTWNFSKIWPLSQINLIN